MEPLGGLLGHLRGVLGRLRPSWSRLRGVLRRLEASNTPLGVGGPNDPAPAAAVLGGSLLDQIQLRSDPSQDPRQSRSSAAKRKGS